MEEKPMDKRIEAIAELLNKHHFTAYAVSTADEAKAKVAELIADAKTVGMGGSTTLARSGIWAMVANDETKTLYNSFYAAKHGQDVPAAMRMGLDADVYITSSNAITEDGSLVNIDGTGNRCAAMFYGPKRVIFVIGKNKIAPDISSAIARIKAISCPNNARRLKKQLPCAITGKCADCNSMDRMCNVTTIIERPTRGKDMHVILVDEEMGD